MGLRLGLGLVIGLGLWWDKGVWPRVVLGAYGKAGIRNPKLEPETETEPEPGPDPELEPKLRPSTETSSRYPCGNKIQDGVLRLLFIVLFAKN